MTRRQVLTATSQLPLMLDKLSMLDAFLTRLGSVSAGDVSAGDVSAGDVSAVVGFPRVRAAHPMHPSGWGAII